MKLYYIVERIIRHNGTMKDLWLTFFIPETLKSVAQNAC